MKVSNAELCTLDVDREVNLTPSAQVLDIAISAMFWSSRYRSGSLFAYLGLYVIRSATSMDVLWLGGLCDDTIEGIGTDQLAFTLVPQGENVCGRSTPEDTWVNEAGKTDMGDVA